MGVGRKTQPFPMKEKPESQWTANSSPPARNLTKDQLCGVIFGCRNHTITECLRNEIFGLPAAHYSYVKNITPGFTLYLFNYSDRTLHGIFRAVSPGQMNISPHAWITNEGSEDTPYPAQVRVRQQKKCRPLPEEEFKPIIEKNYYAEKLFWFELDKEQNCALMKLFISSPLPEKILPHVLAKLNVTETANEEVKNLDREERCGKGEMRLKGNKKWSELFKPSSCEMKNWIVLGSQKGRSNSSMTDCYDMELEFASSSTSPLKARLDSANADLDSQYVIDKLMREIEELKVAMLKQRVKIEILEHELFKAKHK